MENPLAVYKREMDYTFDDLAKQFQVNRSLIQRAIEGAFYSLPPSIIDTLSYIEGIPKAELNKRYSEFVAEQLKSIKRPPVALTKDTSLEDFDIWCSLFLRINGVSFIGEVPHLTVARLLHINVALISNFYSGRTARMPNQILERVDQIGGI